jgi:hypothetical protein
VGKLVDAAKKVSPDHRIRELEQLVERQQEHIERLRKAKFTLPTAKQSGKRNKSTPFLSVFVPDTHGAHIDKHAFRAFLDDLDILRPARVIHLGDAIDCGGFLAMHHTLGFVPQTEYTFEDDAASANGQWDEIQKRAPDAACDYIEGNHELRIERWVIDKTIRNPRDAAYLRRMFSPEIVLHLEERGIRYIRRSECYDGLKVPGTIDLKGCLARHGTAVGKYAAHRTVEQFGTNVTFGHTHRMAMASKESSHGISYGWSFGCLCRLQPLYYDTNPTDWAHGYGVQVVKPGIGFITLQVPIIDGKSFLEPLASELKL